jgi:hypothetical protein
MIYRGGARPTDPAYTHKKRQPPSKTQRTSTTHPHTPPSIQVTRRNLSTKSKPHTKTSKIKVGTPYKLMFTSKVPLQNTTGLFFTVLSDAVDANGNKVNLIVE